MVSNIKTAYVTWIQEGKEVRSISYKDSPVVSAKYKAEKLAEHLEKDGFKVINIVEN